MLWSTSTLTLTLANGPDNAGENPPRTAHIPAWSSSLLWAKSRIVRVDMAVLLECEGRWGPSRLPTGHLHAARLANTDGAVVVGVLSGKHIGRRVALHGKRDVAA